MAKKKNDLPYFPFYIGDWHKAPEVRALPLDTRMVWFEILCFMWESTERGFLTLNGKPIPKESLARMIGTDEERLTFHLTFMSTLEVYSTRDGDGAIFCRKMVRDEDIRQRRKNGGFLGGNPALMNKSKEDKDNHKDNLNGYPLRENENDIDISIKEEGGAGASKGPTPEELAEYHKFDLWINATAPRVQKMKVPINQKSYFELIKFFLKEFNGDRKKAKEALSDLILKMHNWEPLLKKNVDAKLTMQNWYRQRKEEYHKPGGIGKKEEGLTKIKYDNE